MKRSVTVLVWLWIALGLSLGAEALRADVVGNPYQGILGRNAFGLRPPPPYKPEVPPPPLARVKVVGLTTMLGDRRALLKIFPPGQPQGAVKAVSCILKEGQREGAVEVLAIDERAGSVKVSNGGTVTILVLENTKSSAPEVPPLPEPPSLPVQTAFRP